MMRPQLIQKASKDIEVTIILVRGFPLLLVVLLECLKRYHGLPGGQGTVGIIA